MQTRMPTRRCAKGKVPCQQISNIFSSQSSEIISLVPAHILKFLPSTQKLSCQSIQKTIKNLPIISEHDALQKIKNNSKLQFEKIKQLVDQQPEPNNVLDQDYQINQIQLEKQLKFYQTPIRKLLKKDDCTQSVSDYDSGPCKNQDIFFDSKVIDKLEDYLSIQ